MKSRCKRYAKCKRIARFVATTKQGTKVNVCSIKCGRLVAKV